MEAAFYLKKEDVAVLCYNKRQKEKYKLTYDKEVTKGRHLKQKYQLSLESFNRMLEEQGNTCPICLEHLDTTIKSPPVDHCHKTGTIRGILCDSCNRGLSCFKDSVPSLSRAIEYLQKQRPLSHSVNKT